MRHQLIDWVDAVGFLWGRTRRRLDCKQEDWPESVWARIQHGVPPGDFYDQNFLEVFTGETLKFALAQKSLTFKQKCHVYVHYVVIGKPKVKIARFGASRENYYATLADAHRKLASTIASGEFAGARETLLAHASS